MGPSWYWMPDVFESYFETFNKKPSDYYELVRLDPSYSVIFGENDILDIPANLDEFKKMLESLEPGSTKNFDKFLSQGKHLYEISMKDLVYHPNISIFEFSYPRLFVDMIYMNAFKSLSTHIRKYFSNEKIIKILEFPALFLGGTADNIPTFYSLMNYADIVLGTWYPKGGMHEIIKAMVTLAEENEVKIQYSAEVEKIIVENGKAKHVKLKNGEMIEADVIIASADYHHVDKHLLDKSLSNYDENYWDSRILAPSALIYYLGVNKRLRNLRHHNLFFDEPFGPYADTIYGDPRWPEKPLFYVCVTSKTDSTVAPEGMENVFILIPVAVGLEDTEKTREKYYDDVMDRLERITEQEIRSHVIFRKTYAHEDFETDYHAYKGNAYGLANTLMQTAIFKPKIKNDKISNLYYTGQLTTPGPGIPPCLISGQVVAKEVMKDNGV